MGRQAMGPCSRENAHENKDGWTSAKCEPKVWIPKKSVWEAERRLGLVGWRHGDDRRMDNPDTVLPRDRAHYEVCSRRHSGNGAYSVGRVVDKGEQGEVGKGGSGRVRVAAIRRTAMKPQTKLALTALTRSGRLESTSKCAVQAQPSRSPVGFRGCQKFRVWAASVVFVRSGGMSGTVAARGGPPRAGRPRFPPSGGTERFPRAVHGRGAPDSPKRRWAGGGNRGAGHDSSTTNRSPKRIASSGRT